MDTIARTTSTYIKATKCCCCISPRTGILTLAILSIGAAIMNIITISIDNYDEAQREQLSYIRGPIIVYNIASMIVNISLILGVRMGKPVLMFPSICMNFSAIIVLIAGAIAVFTIPSLSLGIAFGIFFTVLLALALMVHWAFITYWYYDDLCASQPFGRV